MSPIHQQTLQLLTKHHIAVIITRKPVKNINFRIKANQLSISAPSYASDNEIADALQQRLNWAIQSHQKLLDKQQNNSKYQTHPEQCTPLMLWGQTHSNIELNEAQRLSLYREELKKVIPTLFTKWQPVVGQTSKEQRIKKMKTRWGSCNVQAKRIWLSVYLPEYPLQCTEYVIVHELCHLHHANHSPKFWQEVSKAMPDYQYWHDLLAGKLKNHRNMMKNDDVD